MPDIAAALDLNPTFHTVRRGSLTIGLSPTEYDVLYILYHYHPAEVPAEVIIRKVWGSQSDKLPKHLSHWFTRLRHKLVRLNVQILSVAKRTGVFVLRVNDT